MYTEIFSELLLYLNPFILITLLNQICIVFLSGEPLQSSSVDLHVSGIVNICCLFLSDWVENLYNNRFTCIRYCTDLLLVFISGEPLQSGSLGMSIPDSVCTKRALGVSQIPSYTEPQKLATVLSHMVGHNLGLKHDEDRK